ncbi:MAG TPA: hypothetical protein VIE43_02175 [Thermoanaerobaculia bacterium]|nr:hypothetical protein [Thermoanaerobaculia bacterium]
MSRWNEREIARKLAERDELEPPAGLLEKIKGEIPPTIPVGVPRLETRRPSQSPQRWLIAASLVAMVGAGLFALRVQREAPPTAALASPAGPPEKDLRAVPEDGGQGAVPLPDALQRRAEESRRPQQALPVPPPPPPLLKKDQEALKALEYSRPPVREQRLQAGVVGGVAGGAVAAPPPPPPAAPAPSPAPKPEVEENIAVVTESPLHEERRAGSARAEPAAPAVRDPWAVLQQTPGVVTDRINVGGNESGRQSEYVGPGNPYADAAAHPVSTFRLVAGAPSDAVSNRVDSPVIYYDFDVFGPMPEPGAVAITAEGAPTPFVPGPRFRLLRFHIGGAPTGTRVEVSFNPLAVARYRPVGDGPTGLYEIELHPGAPRAGQVATLRLVDPPGNEREVALSDFARSWEQASPDFRVSALTARFLDVLKRAPSAKEDLAGIVRQVREIDKQPGGAGAAELADRMEKAAGLRP